MTPDMQGQFVETDLSVSFQLSANTQWRRKLTQECFKFS
jgi:hypothetical protein